MAPTANRIRPSAGSIMSSPHMIWTIGCIALLVLGGLFESTIAQEHLVSVEGLGEHPDASLVAPTWFLTGAVLCGAWPAFRATWRAACRGRVVWQAFIVVAIVGTFGFGHMFEAGLIALAFAVGLTFTTRHENASLQPADRSGSPRSE